jgi:phospholipase C
MSNTRADGVVAAIHPADQNCVQDPGHGWSSSHTQWNGGANDGFVRDYETRTGPDGAHRCMGYLTRALQPATHALVDQAALCQRWFCSVLGPTWPNRYYSQLASSDGNHSNELIRDQTLPSIYQRLDKARIPWTSYYGNIPFSSILPNHSIESDEYQRLDQFFEDAAAGTLRSLVWIDPVYGRADDHPPAHPLAGQVLLGSIYEALRTSPQWNESLLMITYDEHGGFFDHVPPPPVEDVRAADGFTEMGFRVPGLVVGPYVRPHVSSTIFDHTSLIATVLRLHELEPLNVRDESANDVFSLLDEDRLLAEEPSAGEKLPTFEVDESEIYAEGCVTGLPFHAPVYEAFTTQPSA